MAVVGYFPAYRPIKFLRDNLRLFFYLHHLYDALHSAIRFVESLVCIFDGCIERAKSSGHVVDHGLQRILLKQEKRSRRKESKVSRGERIILEIK